MVKVGIASSLWARDEGHSGSHADGERNATPVGSSAQIRGDADGWLMDEWSNWMTSSLPWTVLFLCGAAAAATPLSWTPVPFPAAPEGSANAALADGGVLAVGGCSVRQANRWWEPASGVPTATRLDVAAGRWLPVAPALEKRCEGTALTLRDGRVLLVGGVDAGASPPPELYDPKTDTWRRAGMMPIQCAGVRAALLGDGRAVVHGCGTTSIFDPATLGWVRGPPERTPEGAATLDAGGALMAVGGLHRRKPWLRWELFGDRPGMITTRVESLSWFDGTRWREHALPGPVWTHAVAHADSRAFFFIDREGRAEFHSFDPAARKLRAERTSPQHPHPVALASLGKHHLLLIDGRGRAALYDVKAQTWSEVTNVPAEIARPGRMPQPHLMPLADRGALLLEERWGATDATVAYVVKEAL
jgi:hypothetical protein